MFWGFFAFLHGEGKEWKAQFYVWWFAFQQLFLPWTLILMQILRIPTNNTFLFPSLSSPPPYSHPGLRWPEAAILGGDPDCRAAEGAAGRAGTWPPQPANRWVSSVPSPQQTRAPAVCPATFFSVISDQRYQRANWCHWIIVFCLLYSRGW